jgi:RimJ/RimL family protein N-acetyltransferase
MDHLEHGVRHKVRRLAFEVRRSDLAPIDRALNVSELTLHAASVWPHVTLERSIFYEIAAPPSIFRGLRDLTVRLAVPADVDALSAMREAEPGVNQARLARGDLGFVGELEGRILARVWYLAGPNRFEEDDDLYATFAPAPRAFWSYDAAAAPEAVGTGCFGKVFQTALRALFLEHGAARVQSRVKTTNLPSIAMHERLGFRRLGILGAAVMPGLRWLWWEGDGGRRRWLRPRAARTVLAVPPSETP